MDTPRYSPGTILYQFPEIKIILLVRLLPRINLEIKFSPTRLEDNRKARRAHSLFSVCFQQQNSQLHLPAVGRRATSSWDTNCGKKLKLQRPDKAIRALEMERQSHQSNNFKTGSCHLAFVCFLCLLFNQPRISVSFLTLSSFSVPLNSCLLGFFIYSYFPHNLLLTFTC